MSTNELREAAERWGQFCEKLSGVTFDIGDVDTWIKGISEHWDKYPGGAEQADTDKVTLSSAYLSERDETPIDEAWLVVVGGVKHGSRGMVGRLVTVDARVCFFFWPDGSVDVELSGGGKAVATTRGQLRRLCAALGIELKEGTA